MIRNPLRLAERAFSQESVLPFAKQIQILSSKSTESYEMTALMYIPNRRTIPRPRTKRAGQEKENFESWPSSHGSSWVTHVFPVGNTSGTGKIGGALVPVGVACDLEWSSGVVRWPVGTAL